MTDAIDRGKELEFATELVMVALEGFFLLLQVCVHFILRGICDTVNALQHLVVLITLPISAGALGQFERLNGTRAEEVRACAKVGKFALFVEADNSILGELLDQLNLIGLVFFLHQGNCLGSGKLKALDFEVFLNDLLHFTLDCLECICAKRNLGVDIIVVAIVDSGTDGELCVGIQSFNCLRQNVCGGVAEEMLACCILKGEKLDLGISRQLLRESYGLAVNFGTDNGARNQLHILCRIINGYGSIVFSYLIQNFDFHGWFSFLYVREKYKTNLTLHSALCTLH